MIKAGIIGGSGYTAGELIRILTFHPDVEIDFVYSTTNARKPVVSQHKDLIGDLSLSFTNTFNPDIDVLFLCLGHGRSRAFLENLELKKSTKIIDLGNDFRLTEDQSFKHRKFVYGLPELNKSKLKKAQNIANPGCFATAIQLGLLPLAHKDVLHHPVHINATTGSTGAGVMPSSTTHFSWRDNNFSSYKMFDHQHLGEIKKSLSETQNDFQTPLYFVPNRGNFSRGIYAVMYTRFEDSFEDAKHQYKAFYEDDPFTFISLEEIVLKQVINTNKCILHLQKKEGMLVITSIIDNLLKGASGQAVQNMNLAFGLNEKTGLSLKGSAF